MRQGDNSSRASVNIIDLNGKLIACCQDQKKLLGLLLSSVHDIVFQLNSLSPTGNSFWSMFKGNVSAESFVVHCIAFPCPVAHCHITLWSR